MTPALRANLCTAALGQSLDCVRDVLTTIGQGVPERALDTLFDKHPATAWCQSWNTMPENAVMVLNLVVPVAMKDKRISMDQIADLAAFFIQRMKFMELTAQVKFMELRL